MTQSVREREMQKTLQERLRGQHALCRGMSPVFLYDEAADAIDTLQSDLSKAVEALKPFAQDAMPSLKRTERDYNEHGLRTMMSPMEIARKRAREAYNHLTRDKG